MDKRKVFVIHGRNEGIKVAVHSFLHSLRLRPIDWSEAIQMTGKPSPYIGEILAAAFKAARV